METSSINPKDILGIKKPPLQLIPPAGTIAEAMAFKNGADKYGPYNWREKDVGAMTYIGAIKRHIDQYLDGEDFAEDSGVHHLGHIKACCSILLDAHSIGNLIDDRPKPGKASDLIKEYTVV